MDKTIPEKFLRRGCWEALLLLRKDLKKRKAENMTGHGERTAGNSSGKNDTSGYSSDGSDNSRHSRQEQGRSNDMLRNADQETRLQREINRAARLNTEGEGLEDNVRPYWERYQEIIEAGRESNFLTSTTLNHMLENAYNNRYSEEEYNNILNDNMQDCEYYREEYNQAATAFNNDTRLLQVYVANFNGRVDRHNDGELIDPERNRVERVDFFRLPTLDESFWEQWQRFR